jgi:hypothetical protein
MRVKMLCVFVAVLGISVCNYNVTKAQTYGQVIWGQQQGTTTPNIVIFDGTNNVSIGILNTIAHTFVPTLPSVFPSGGTYPSPIFTGTATGANLTLSGNLTAANITLAPTVAGTIVSASTAITQSLSSTPDYSFVNNESLPSFPSGNTHFDFVIQSGKTAVGSNTTGSRQAFTAQQLGAGGTATDYFTAGYELTMPTAGSFNLLGNFTANNPLVSIPTGMTPTSAVGEEVDVTTKSNVTNIREGVRIVDIGSTGLNGAGIDAAIGISSSGIGFGNGINFGDSGGTNFPISSGGNLINTAASSVGLAAGVSLVGLTGTYTFAPILLAANNKGIWWGTTKQGGSLVSETASNGPDIVLGSSNVAFRFAGTPSVFVKPNAMQLVNVNIATLLAMTCNAGSAGSVAFVSDTTAAAAPTFHLIVAGSGATTVNSLTSCNGTNWVYD